MLLLKKIIPILLEQVQTKDTSLVDDAIEDANATQELQLTTDEKKVKRKCG